MDKPKVTVASCAEGNYRPGRSNYKVRYIIIHTMQGTLKGTTAWFANPKARGSAHYGIGFGGELVQWVDDGDTAYHAGNLKYNREAIGIELEGFCERGFFPDAMMEKLIELVRYLSKRYKIPMSRAVILGHNEIPDPYNPKLLGGAHHHSDPGSKFPWAELMRQLVPPKDDVV